jgi:hypothetical protein
MQGGFMSWVAVGVGGATLVGGLLGAGASRRAAAEQQATSRAAIAEQGRQYDQTRADQQPWRDAGKKAIGDLSGMDMNRHFTVDDFNKDPGYQFRMDEANKAMERGASARGGLQSGGTLKALSRYNQDYASGEYNNAYNRFNQDQSNTFNRLAAVSGIGQTANNQVGQAGQNMANNTAELLTGIGNAQAGGTMGQANAISNGIGQGMNTWMQYQMMNRLAPQAGS